VKTKHVKAAWGTHTASLAAVLSNVHDVLVCTLDEAYALQDFLVGRPLMTHERVSEEADQGSVATILAVLPELAEAAPPGGGWSFPDDMPVEQRKAICEAWVAEVAEYVGYDTVTWDDPA